MEATGNRPVATKAIVRDRYWGHQARQSVAGRPADVDEVRAVGRLIGADMTSLAGMKEAMGDIIVAQTLIRSATGIPNEAPLMGDPRLSRWEEAMRAPQAQLTFDMNALKERALHYALHNHRLQGEQEFEFGPRLVEEFRQTDVDDVLCSEVSLPYGTFYMRFQGLEGTTFEDRPLDGFLLWQSQEDGLHVYPLSSTPLAAWGPLDEPGRCTYSNFTVRNLQRPDEPFVEVARAIVDELGQMAATARTAPLGEAPDGWNEAVAANHESARDAIVAQHTSWMRLIVNGLLTIDSGGIEATRAYPGDAPADLAEKAMSGRPGARKADQKLRAAGYVTLRRYEVPDQVPSGLQGDRTVSPHWRRGHWRRQHYGAANAFTRRVRIAPVMVMAGAGDPSPRKGYRV